MSPKRFFCLVISIFMVFTCISFSCVSFADDSDTDSSYDITSQYEEAGIILYQIGMLASSSSKGLNLDGQATRIMGAQMAVKLIGAADIVTENDYWTSYGDIPSDQSSYVGYLENLGVDISRNETEFGFLDIMGTECYLITILQTLGYQDITKYSSSDEIYNRAISVGLLTEEEASQLRDVSFTRGTLAYITLKALDVIVNGTDYTVYTMVENSGDLKHLDYPSDTIIYGRSALVDQVIANAYKYMGVRYVYGGKSPTGFDCSGFVQYVEIESGVWGKYYGDCNSISTVCTKVSVSEARAGDLVFFQGTSSKSGYTHVGIYLGDGMMIHCSSSKGVSVASIYSSYWSSHFATIARINALAY